MIATFRLILWTAALALSLAACQMKIDEAPPSEPLFNGTPMSQVTLPPPPQEEPEGIIVRDQTLVNQRIALIDARAEDETAEPTTEPTQAAPEATPTPPPPPDPEPMQIAALPPSPSTLALPEGAVGELGVGSVIVRSLSPSGEFLAVDINEQTYVLKAGTLQRMWRARLVGKVTWLADGQRVGIGSVIYDIVTGTEVASLPLDAHEVAYTPDGLTAATHDSAGTVVVWDVPTGARMWNMPAPEEVSHMDDSSGWSVRMVFSPDSQNLALSWTWQAGCMVGNDQWVHVYSARGGGAVGDFTVFNSSVWGMTGSWSPTGKYLAVHADDDYTSGITVWNVEMGAVSDAQVADLQSGTAVAWLPDGTRFAVLNGQTIDIWDAATATRLTGYALPMDYANRLKISRDGTLAAIGSYRDPHVLVLNIVRGEIVAQWEQAGELVGFGTDNNTVIAGLGMQNSLAVWQPDAPAQPIAHLQGATGINSLAWSPDGAQILSTVGAHYGHRDGLVNWDVPTLTANFAASGTAYVDWVSGDADNVHVDWSSDGRLAAISTVPEYDATPQLTVIDVPNRAVLYTIKNITPLQAEFSPDGSRIAVRDTRNRIMIYAAANGERIGGVDAVQQPIDMTWSPDGTQIAVASVDYDDVWLNYDDTGKVHVFDAASGGVLYELGGITGPALSVAWSPDGARIAASNNTDVAIWNTGAAKSEPDLWLYSLIEREEFSRLGFTDIAFSPDGMMIAGAYGMPITRWYCNGCGYGDRGQVMVWNSYTAERMYRFDGHADEVQTVAFSPDGTRLASGSLDGTILLWDVTR